MFNTIVKPVSIVVSLATLAGILLHEMHIDRATTAAVALPAIFASAGAADYLLKSNHHTHVERITFEKHHVAKRVPLPRIQPPPENS